jgi:Cu(I)/Ag(I) efflux system membrane fusion protein
MSKPNAFHGLDNLDPRNDEGGLRAPPGLSPLRKLWWWFHFLVLVKLARLRFIVVLVAIGLVIAKWDLLSAWYEKLTRPLLGQQTAVNSDTEYWCPMDPAIVRDHPDTCPICHMPLSKRKKGEKQEDEALPPGIGGRVPLTPYKVAVAGVETVPLAYRPLTRAIHAVGFVEFNETTLAHIALRQKATGRIAKLFVNYTGQMVDEGEKLAVVDIRYSQGLMTTLNELRVARQNHDRNGEELARQRLRVFDVDDKQIQEYLKTGKVESELTIVSPMHGHVIKKYQREGNFVENGTPLYDVADLSTVWIEAQVYEDDLLFVQDAVEKKLPVTATTQSFPNREFKGEIVFVHPHLDAATRTLMVRFNMDNPKHELRPGMYATVHLQVPITRAVSLGSEADAERKKKFQEGQVLAVPERAVIDTGSHKFVYREVKPDLYEGVEVQLGPRCDDYYPVLAGLQAGDRVVTTGSFLIDAETRLGPGASSTYYGASGSRGDSSAAKTAARPSMTRDEDSKVRAALAKLSPEERRLAEEQKICPVLGGRLGAMGAPVPVMLDGRKVLLCCKSCLSKAQADPKGMLAKLDAKKAGNKDGGGVSAAEKEIRDNLAKLKPEDRRLAEEQRFCPIETKTRLGSMDVPVFVMIKGRKVFLCCEACMEDAMKNQEKTLAQVEKLKAK